MYPRCNAAISSSRIWRFKLVGCMCPLSPWSLQAQPWTQSPFPGRARAESRAPTLPRRAFPQMTGGDLTWSCVERHRWEGPSAAMPHWSRRCPECLPNGGAATWDGAVLNVAKRGTYPELAQGGAQSLSVLGCEVGGRWNASAISLVQRLVKLHACRAPPAAVRGPTQAAWAMVEHPVQRAVRHTALGRARAVLDAAQDPVPCLDEILALAPNDGPNRLPWR